MNEALQKEGRSAINHPYSLRAEWHGTEIDGIKNLILIPYLMWCLLTTCPPRNLYLFELYHELNEEARGTAIDPDGIAWWHRAWYNLLTLIPLTDVLLYAPLGLMRRFREKYNYRPGMTWLAWNKPLLYLTFSLMFYSLLVLTYMGRIAWHAWNNLRLFPLN